MRIRWFLVFLILGIDSLLTVIADTDCQESFATILNEAPQSYSHDSGDPFTDAVNRAFQHLERSHYFINTMGDLGFSCSTEFDQLTLKIDESQELADRAFAEADDIDPERFANPALSERFYFVFKSRFLIAPDIVLISALFGVVAIPVLLIVWWRRGFKRPRLPGFLRVAILGHTLNYDGSASVDEICKVLANLVPTFYVVSRKNDRLLVRKDGLRGCTVTVKQKKCKVELFPSIPSYRSQLAVSLPIIAASLICVFFVNLYLGAFLLSGTIYLRRIPAVPIADEIAGLLRAHWYASPVPETTERAAASTGPRTWIFLAAFLCGVLLVGMAWFLIRSTGTAYVAGKTTSAIEGPPVTSSSLVASGRVIAAHQGHSNATEYEIEVALMETDLLRIKVGQSTSTTLAAYPDLNIPGKVSSIWPFADRQRSQIEVHVVLLESDPRLQTDMAADVEFLIE